MGRIIEFAGNGQTFRGYLAEAHARDAHQGAATGAAEVPGVIVIQEWWGLVEHVKDICDRFAAAGFNALAPDLYAGRSTTSPDEAGRLFMALDIAHTELALRGAVAALLATPGTRGGTVGVVGFCMGGQLALFAASKNPEIGACVDFYGIHPRVAVDFKTIEAPVLAFFAEHDTFVDTRAMIALAEGMHAAGKRLEVHRYLDAGHAFFNDARPEAYHPQHAADAWARTKAFLMHYVAGPGSR